MQTATTFSLMEREVHPVASCSWYGIPINPFNKCSRSQYAQQWRGVRRYAGIAGPGAQGCLRKYQQHNGRTPHDRRQQLGGLMVRHGQPFHVAPGVQLSERGKECRGYRHGEHVERTAQSARYGVVGKLLEWQIGRQQQLVELRQQQCQQRRCHEAAREPARCWRPRTRKKHRLRAVPDGTVLIGQGLRVHGDGDQGHEHLPLKEGIESWCNEGEYGNRPDRTGGYGGAADDGLGHLTLQADGEVAHSRRSRRTAGRISGPCR